MQKSQLVNFLIIAAITIVMILMGVVLFNETLDHARAKFLSSIEMSFSFVLRFIGLALLLFSIVSLLMAGSNANELKNYAKWIALIILSMLIMHPAWYLVFGVVIILSTLIIIEYLKCSKKSPDIQTTE